MQLGFDEFEQAYNDRIGNRFDDPPSVRSDLSVDSAICKNMRDIHKLHMDMALEKNKYATVDKTEEIKGKYRDQISELEYDLQMIDQYKRDSSSIEPHMLNKLYIKRK